MGTRTAELHLRSRKTGHRRRASLVATLAAAAALACGCGDDGTILPDTPDTVDDTDAPDGDGSVPDGEAEEGLDVVDGEEGEVRDSDARDDGGSGDASDDSGGDGDGDGDDDGGDGDGDDDGGGGDGDDGDGDGDDDGGGGSDGDGDGEVLITCGDGVLDPGEECDDGNDSPGDGCEPGTCAFSCHYDLDCDDGLACNTDACDATGSHACRHEILLPWTPCRTAGDVCDAEEFCDGASPACPADAFRPDTARCRAASDQCDASEFCTGSSADCPPDVLLPAGAPCDDASPCSYDDRCDGSGTCRGTTGLHDMSAVSAGGDHTCGLTRSGIVMCWGRNSWGQLGDGTSTDRTAPVQVAGLPSASAVAAGRNHTCALVTGGSVMCWGDNRYGQLGDGTTSSASAPVRVAGLETRVESIAAGRNHTCARLDGGGVACWGAGGNGQLGNGGWARSLVPARVAGLPGAATAIAAGGGHTCALVAGGALCWGSNWSGQLGEPSAGFESTAPVALSALSSGVASISAGDKHTCAVVAGAARCWGNNFEGQLGDGTSSGRDVPAAVLGLSSGVAAVSAGGMHTCAVLTTGAVECWGSNWSGQLGDGLWVASPTHRAVSGLPSGAAAVSAGAYHTCTVLAGTGGVKCWGNNDDGRLGDDTRADGPVPAEVPGLAFGIDGIATGRQHECALSGRGQVLCRGRNEYGQLGDGSTVASTTPITVPGLRAAARQVVVGLHHTCAALADGSAWCWGRNDYGQLGDATTVDRHSPAAVMGLPSAVASLAAGGYHTCALLETGAAMCWGRNTHAQLGDGTWNDRTRPASVSGLGAGVVVLAAGDLHTCAALVDGSARCVGFNGDGRLGDGTWSWGTTPVPVAGLPPSGTSVVGLAAGGRHTCGLLDTGAVLCWGANDGGQIGDGTEQMRPTPVPVVGLAAASSGIAAGESHTCARADSGQSWCWGRNAAGQLGEGSTADRPLPAAVRGLTAGVSALSAGGSRSCALLATGAVACWGTNVFAYRPEPVDVVCRPPTP